jgi:hypothetical protein
VFFNSWICAIFCGEHFGGGVLTVFERRFLLGELSDHENNAACKEERGEGAIRTQRS